MATTQARVLPRGAGVLLIVGGIANLVAVLMWPLSILGSIGHFFFAAGLIWVGYALVFQQEEETVQPVLPVTDIGKPEVHG